MGNESRIRRFSKPGLAACGLGTVLYLGTTAAPALALTAPEAPGSVASPTPVVPELTDPFAAILDVDAERRAEEKAQQAQDREQQAAEAAKRGAAERARAATATSRGMSRRTTPVKAGSYDLTARFGQAGGWSTGHHTGLDFAAPVGTDVHVVADGRVISSGWAGAYGNRIEVDHGGGVVTTYNHLSNADVSAGDDVSAGQKIGDVGTTGRSTGPHLHFEVEVDGSFRDPYTWLGLG